MVKNRNLWIKISSAALGGLGGFLYWKFVGCSSGACPIQSVWYFSTLWGMAMGYLLSDLLVSYLLRHAPKND